MQHHLTQDRPSSAPRGASSCSSSCKTDTGLVGAQRSAGWSAAPRRWMACIEELAPRHVFGIGPVRRRAARVEHPARRVRSPRRGFAVGARVFRRRVLGPDGPVARRAGLEVARREVPRPRAGVRERLVSVRARAARRSPALAKQVVVAAGTGPEAGSVRARQRRARAPTNAAGPSRSSPPCAKPSDPTCKIMVEMHGRFTPATAAAMAKQLEPFDPEWIEEPTPPENAAGVPHPCAARRICRSPRANARTRWKTSAGSSKADWSTSSRSI